MHPEAAKLPPMSDAGVKELAEDIKANGLQEPIILWRDNRDEAKGKDGPFPLYLLDGRNRMAALELLGITNPHQAPTGQGGYEEKVRILNAVKCVSTIGPRGGMKDRWVPDTDPATLVLSMNVHRRHLTTKQKREAIMAYVKANPRASNRKVARELKVSHHTVAAARDDVQGGQVAQNEQPADRAAAVLQANPEMTQREVAAEAGVSPGTVSKVRKKLEAGGEIPPRKEAAARPRKSTPKPPPEPSPDPEDKEAVKFREAARELLRKGKWVMDHYDSTALTPEDIEGLRDLSYRISTFTRR